MNNMSNGTNNGASNGSSNGASNGWDTSSNNHYHNKNNFSKATSLIPDAHTLKPTHSSPFTRSRRAGGN